MRIGTVARMAGVGVETIRFYQRKGLIEQPVRPEGSGYRTYSQDSVARIRLIRQAQGLGFSLREIEDLLSLEADPAADCADVRAQAEAKLVEVERKIARLVAIRSALRDLINACPGAGVATRRCSILDALQASGTERDSRHEGKDTKP